jgi:hypothetical protein
MHWSIKIATVSLSLLAAVGAAADDRQYQPIASIKHVGELYFGANKIGHVADPNRCRAYREFKSQKNTKPEIDVGWVHGGLPTGIIFTRELGSLNAKMLMAQDPAYTSTAKNLLLDWARADAMRYFQQENGSYWWAAYEMLPAALITEQMLDTQHALSAAEQEAIDTWFSRLIAQTQIGAELPLGSAGYQDRQQRVGNINTRRNLVAMLWAIRTDDAALFNWSVDHGYLRFLANIADDGSLIDANRGKWAMRYTNFNIGAAMFMGEAAAHQGVDLFGLSVNGHSIHTAVRFMLDAGDDESLIDGYAAQDIGMGGMPFTGRQDPYWAGHPGFESAIGWIEAYIKRFPNHPNSKRLRKLLASWGSEPLIDLSFGNVSCVYGGQ